MSWSPTNRLIPAIILMVVLPACTTTVEISHSETHKVATLKDNFRTVNTQETSEPLRRSLADAQGGFFLVELKTKTDLEKIVRRKEMAFLYYELRACGSTKESPKLYSAPAYIDAQVALSEADSFYYYAPVPEDYQSVIDRHQAMLGKEKVALPSEICIGLGAGNMVGQTLTTNFVRAELE